MPLLSLPRELLFEIIGYVAASTPPTPKHSFGEAKALAHTCAILRSLSITILYASVTIRREAGQLGHLLINYPHLVRCVRRLKLEAPRIWARDSQHLIREILERCIRLQELTLEKLPGTSSLRTGFEGRILEYLPIDSKQSVKTIVFNGLSLDGLLAHFKWMLSGEFSALQTLRMHSHDVCNSYDVSRHKEEQIQLFRSLLLYARASPTGALKSVQSFVFNAPFPYRLPEEPEVAACFANAMPNLKSLTMTTSVDVIYGSLSAYVNLGSQLTELVLTASYPSGPRANAENDPHKRIHFCDIITKISHNLRKFVVFGNTELRICHTLFNATADCDANCVEIWSNLDLLNISTLRGCDGIKPWQLRQGLKKLTSSRPGAVLFMEGRFHEKLISWNARSPEGVALLNAYGFSLVDDVIGGLDAFRRLTPPELPPPPHPNHGARVVTLEPANWNPWGVSNYEDTKAPWY